MHIFQLHVSKHKLGLMPYVRITVKPAYAVTSIKQPPALKNHLLLVQS